MARRLEIVAIEQEPLREKAGSECRSAMLRLEEARTSWHRFERKDKPAFVRWRAREFGALLSRGRELEVEIRECESLVYETEMEMRRTIVDPQTAYQRVMARRANPSAPEAPGKETGEGKRASEFEQETLFQEWVRKFVGTNPDKMDDDAYDTSFAAFKSHMFSASREAAQPHEESRPKRQPRREEEPLPPADPRVKELYRLLVRRLHPDLRADGDATVSGLWHEVQEAYAMSDVGRMEILLALSEIESDSFGEQTTLAQMRMVRDELARALDALERSLILAKGDAAWDFASKGADQALHDEVRQELERNFARRTARLQALRKIIAEWASPVQNLQVVRVHS